MKLYAKRFLIVLLTTALLLSFWTNSGTALAQETQDFDIISFEADYYIDRTDQRVSRLRVVETIVAQFPTYDQNHGILRVIPEKYQGHSVGLDIEAIENENNQRYAYTADSEAGNLILKIGTPNAYVHGRQTYKITYSMRDVVVLFDDHEEFYWDINGDQWKQQTDIVTARLHLYGDVARALQPRQQCYAGTYGSSDTQRCVINRSGSGDEVMITASVNSLAAGENLSLVLGFDKGTFIFSPELVAEGRRQRLLIVAAVAAATLPPLFTTAWIFRRWRKYGRDPEGRGLIIPEYQPPKNFNAVTSSAIISEHVETKAVSALMIELAVSKYLRIYEIPKSGLFGKVDYELEIIKDPQSLSSEQIQTLKMFFGDALGISNKVTLSSLKNKLSTKMGTLSSVVGKQLYEQGYFASNPDHARSSYVTRGVVLLIIAFVVSFLGFTIPLAIGLGLSGGLLILFKNIMPARTILGVNIRNHILGLKEYMKMAEADRIRYLQSPEGAEKANHGFDPNNPREQVKLFEKLLPYAMLFGIEKDWAKQFKDLYSQPPDWYHGNWNTFSAVHLASSLSSFNSMSTASFTAPSSSGSSGFGGGGFSGGGGGGGGGGGW